MTEPQPTGQEQQGGQVPQSTGNYGESKYGERLVYKQTGCLVGWNDPVFAVLYYLHVLTIITLIVVFWGVIIPGYVKGISGLSTVNTSQSTESPIKPIFYACIGISVVVSALWGVAWLKICERFPRSVIKFALFMEIGVWIAVAILGVVQNNTGLIAAGIVLALLFLLYTWCVWSKIPFSSVLLSISAAVIQTFQGTIWIGISTVPINTIWYAMWFMATLGLIFDYVWRLILWHKCITTQALNCYSGSSGCWGMIRTDSFSQYCTVLGAAGSKVNQPTFSGVGIFLLLVSMYWGFNMTKNIAHTTTCGVMGAWYFSPDVTKATGPAFKRTMTTSFGSVALGSLLVALLQALRAILRSQRHGVLACIVYCFLLCIEALIRFFNKYAFAQCAIYGLTFVEAAKATWALLSAKGFDLIINATITGIALTAGGLIGFVISFGVTFLVLSIDKTSNVYINLALSFPIALIGYAFCAQILQVLDSAITALFVCFAEDPAALEQNRKGEYQALVDSQNENVTRYIQTGYAGVPDNEANAQEQKQ